MYGLDSSLLQYGLPAAVALSFVYLLIGWVQWRRWGRWRVVQDPAIVREMRAVFLLAWWRIIPGIKREMDRNAFPESDPVFHRPARIRVPQREWPKWLTLSRWFGGERRGYDRHPVRRPRSAWLDGDV